MSPEMKCLEREKIFGLVHHLLESAEEAESRRHVFHCAECRSVAQSFEKFDSVLGEWREEKPSPWFDQRLKQALPARGPASGIRFLFSLPLTRAFAAALVMLFLVAGSLVVYRYRETGPAGAAQNPVARVPPAAANQNQAPTGTSAQPLPPEEELKMYQNLAVLDNFELLDNFDVLSELPKGNKVAQ